jgi:hypothetical protein
VTDGPDKVRETRLRRAARRQGLELVKIRRYDKFASDYNRYRLTRDNELVLDTVTIDSIEQYLTRSQTDH